jgi:hypothetical protein
MVTHLGFEPATGNRERSDDIRPCPRCADSGITTEIKTPAEASRALRDPGIGWLRELRQMRGRVIYIERGRDASFLSPDGDYLDADPFDSDAYHILLRAGERLVGCARVSLLRDDKPGYIATLLGREQLAEVLNTIGATWAQSCEASRWVVAPQFRNLGLGPRVVATAWALARSLELRTAFVLAGTQHGQDQMLCRMGAQPVPGIPTLPAGRIGEEVRLLKFENSAPALITRKKIDIRRMLTALQMPLSVNDGVASNSVRSTMPC